MKINFSKKTLLILLLILSVKIAGSQEKIMIDRVVATVGDKIILQSDIENQVIQIVTQGYPASENMDCEVLNQLLTQKLLLTQAELDSIQVGAGRVESELERRLMYFIRQVGSEKKLEEFYNKSIIEIKEDFRPLIEEQLKTQMMQSNLVSEIDISPRAVQKFYKDQPDDSIPMINTQYEINQILIYPSQNEEAKNEAREKLLSLRQRIIDGERFSTLAVLYSEDPGSARRGGELGFRSKDELDPEFAKAAFKLSDDGGISRIVESEYGFHIIQLIARESNQVNVRHILVIPKVDIEQKVATKNKLDSITNLIKLDSLTFAKAALKFSEDEQSRLNEGLMVNPMNASTRFALDELPSNEYSVIKDLKIGEISQPFESRDENGKIAYKIVKIKKQIEAHRANLKDDYELIEQMALMEKQMEVVDKWIEEKKKKTYIHIDDSALKCEFLKNGWIK
ncbi:MAG TPA: peptidylprolyl isomerase [Bacteroidales bacterium]|jgi:peptidyl-prolyl cis-trans isomerase SurA|nr:peptidylprolyl isomerase [Bacteroidales bacterium]